MLKGLNLFAKISRIVGWQLKKKRNVFGSYSLSPVKRSRLADDIEIVPKLDYIAFKKNSNMADICIQHKGLKLWINLRKGQLDDSKELTRDVSNIGHWGNGDYELIIKSSDDLEYILSLIKQAI